MRERISSLIIAYIIKLSFKIITLREVKKYLKNKGLFIKPIVSRLAKGNNYISFLVKDLDQFYVLKTRRPDVVGEKKLNHEFNILKFLQNKNINFVQRPFFLDAKKHISILSFIPGRVRSISSLNVKQQKLFLEQLKIVYDLKYKDYLDFCRQEKIEPLDIQFHSDRIKEFSLKRWEYTESNYHNQKILEWIKIRLPEVLKEEKARKNKGVIIFNHRDLAGSNIILNKNGIYFIDWDQARYCEVYDYWLAYMLIHDEGWTKSKKDFFVNLFSDLFGIKKEILICETERSSKLIRINGVLWAAMNIAKSKKTKRKSLNYEKILKQRIQEYEKLYE